MKRFCLTPRPGPVAIPTSSQKNPETDRRNPDKWNPEKVHHSDLGREPFIGHEAVPEGGI